jgi:mannan polymerase II complex MNN11 subunit
VAARHAMTKFPDAKYIWYLDQDAYIMNPRLTVEEHVMNPSKLDEEMIRNLPVVPPDSIIKTFGNLKGKDVELALTQDKDGLVPYSFVLKNGEWAKYFLDVWFNPIYRSYNFQKAELHALVGSRHFGASKLLQVEMFLTNEQEHIVQWHPTILSKMAIIRQRTLNPYSRSDRGELYKDGDMIVRFHKCMGHGEKSCAKEAEKFEQQWRSSFKNY